MRKSKLLLKPSLKFAINLVTGLELHPVAGVAVDDCEILRMFLYQRLEYFRRTNSVVVGSREKAWFLNLPVFGQFWVKTVLI